MPRLLPGLVLVMVVSACVQGGTDSPTDDAGNVGSAASTTTTLGRLGLEQVTLSFASCMRDQGIETPDLRLDAQGRPMLDDLRAGVDTTSPEFRLALTECAPILTLAGALDLRRDPELQAVIVNQLQAFAECVRAEGLETFPDPDPTFSGVGSPFPTDEIPFSDPSFEVGVEMCQEALGSLSLNGG